MRIKSLALVSVLALVFAGLAGCGNTTKTSRQQRRESIANFLSGDTTGEIGESYQTKWFEFTVQSIEKVVSYAGYTAEEGCQLSKRWAMLSIRETVSIVIPGRPYRSRTSPQSLYDKSQRPAVRISRAGNTSTRTW